MHHFEEFDIKRGDGFDIIFKNKKTGRHVRVNIPRAGAAYDPHEEMTEDEVREVARDIAEVLSRRLTGKMAGTE